MAATGGAIALATGWAPKLILITRAAYRLARRCCSNRCAGARLGAEVKRSLHAGGVIAVLVDLSQTLAGAGTPVADKCARLWQAELTTAAGLAGRESPVLRTTRTSGDRLADHCDS